MTPITGAKNEYHSGNIHLYQMDCNELMAQLPEKYADLAIVDPPYGIGDFTKVGDANFYKKRSEAKYGKAHWNNEIPSEEYFDELLRISENRIIWGANYYWQFIPEKNFIVWYKKNDSSRWSKCEIASTTIGVNNFVELEWNGFKRCEKTIRIHPTQKPVQLYKWLLKNYAKPEFKIIDTHLGSMSSVIAAYDFGVSEFIGAELDPDYFAAGVKRFKTHQLQQTFNFEK
jgi:site-specific DNA-methyltransferase (adenine-specific)